MKITQYLSNENNRLKCLGQFETEYKNRDFVEEQNHPDDIEQKLINIYPDIERQTYGGIGGAFSSSSAVALSKLSDDKQEEVIKAYFDRKDGIGYSFGRLTIASCDFSECDYTYVEENDMALETFDLSHDENLIFPMVRSAMKYADLTLFASPWSPPAYMKTGNSRIGGHLRRDCYDLWAKYIARYIDECAKHGIPVWGVTMQNEPRHHQIWESCLYSSREESDFLGCLGKQLHSRNVKILCYDHCRERAYERLKYMLDNENAKYLSGVAHHWYSGDHFGILRTIYEQYPDMISVASESCVPVQKAGINPESELTTAEMYAHDIIGAFDNGLNYYCDWNLVLDQNNGPSHNRENRNKWAEALIYCDSSSDSVVRRLGYYYVGHISKFVIPGAKVVTTSSYTGRLDCCAFKNPNGDIVLVVLNCTDDEDQFTARINDNIFETDILPHSIVTLVIEK